MLVRTASRLPGRFATAGLLAWALAVGVIVAPAATAAPATTSRPASPQQEALLLTALQSAWRDLTRKEQHTTCAGYRQLPAVVIASSVDSVWAMTDMRDNMTRKGWRRVVRQYLAWACSGPGTTPR